jgi:hypothetical protein
MLRIVLLLFVLALAASQCATQKYIEHVSATKDTAVYIPSTPERAAKEREAMRFACEMVQPPIPCEYAPQPALQFVEFDRPNLWGQYRIGSGVIKIASHAMMNAADEYYLLIVVHEAAHYYQWLKGTVWTKCNAEHQAFDIENVYAVRLGLENDYRVDTWDDVKGLYGCSEEPKRGDK